MNTTSDFIQYRRHLPHRHKPDSTLFLTWRQADSLPSAVLARTKLRLENWLAQHPKPWSEELWRHYYRLYAQRIDRWLDRGIGSCLLRHQQNSRIMADAFHHFDAQRYTLFTFVVMPNHVHVLLQLHPGWPLAKIAHSLKSYTATEINKRENRTGSLWQQEVWDRIVRGPGHFQICREYILQNPVKARLREGEYVLYDWQGV